MKTRKLTAIVSIILLAAMALTFTSCVQQDMLYSDDNAYVSIYVYDKTGKKKTISIDNLRVAPDADNEEAYRQKPTGLYALEVACTEKKLEAPDMFVAEKDGVKEYTILKISTAEAGADSNGDIYNWTFKVNGVEADPATAILKTYDLLEFNLVEETFRTFKATFSASNGAVIVLEDTDFALPAEKYELTVAGYLEGSYKDGDKTVDVDSTLKLKLSEDKKHVTEIDGIKADDTHEWVVLINEEEIDANLNEILVYENSVKNNINISFEYREIVIDETTGEGGEAPVEE